MYALLLVVVGAGFGCGAWLCLAGVRGVRLLPELSTDVGADSSTLLRKVTGGLVAGFVVLAVTGWWVGGAGVCIGIVLFWGRLGSSAAGHADTELSEAIAAWTEMVHSVLHAGGGLEKAIATSAKVAPDSIAPTVQKLALRIETATLTRAMAEFASELAHPAADKVAAAVTLSAEHGTADLAGLLASQVESTRKEVRAMLEVEASRTRFRTSARIIVVVTLGMAVGLWVFAPELLSFYESLVGQVMLAAVIGLFLMGFALLTTLARAPQPERYFSGAFAVGSERADVGLVARD